MKTVHTALKLKTVMTAVLTFFLYIPATAQTKDLSVESCVKWNTGVFESTTSMDVEKAGLVMPSARIVGTERIVLELPLLIKEALFALPVDASTTLGDTVAAGEISLDDVADVIEKGRQGSAYFSGNMKTLSIPHTTLLTDIAALFIHHRTAYPPDAPLEYRPSRKYTGIIIDARGKLAVHGESVSDKLHPCLFPRIWDTSMNMLYDRDTADPDIARTRGIITYATMKDIEKCQNITGNDPLRITARSIFGQNRTDIRISKDDALKILVEADNRKLLQQARIVVICDDDALENHNLAPVKDERYYYTFSKIAAMIPPELIDDIEIDDTYKGAVLSLFNIRFKPDSAEFLQEETIRMDSIAAGLKSAGTAEFEVAGHAANVGKPKGEQRLALERAQSIVNAMVARGLPESAFSVKSYGSSMPIADNSTAEGRMRNRRVEIIIKLR